MNLQELINTEEMLVANDKDILAMDESFPTCNRRFAKLEIPETVEKRRAYREMIVTTPGLGEFISGAILFDETIRQKTKSGISMIQVIKEAGIIPEIKVDAGTNTLPRNPV